MGFLIILAIVACINGINASTLFITLLVYGVLTFISLCYRRVDMKRLIIDIPDEYAGAVSVTAIGVGQIGMRSETHIKTTVVVLEGECTEIKLEAEERDV